MIRADFGAAGGRGRDGKEWGWERKGKGREWEGLCRVLCVSVCDGECVVCVCVSVVYQRRM